MYKLLIIAAIAVSCLAAPTENTADNGASSPASVPVATSSIQPTAAHPKNSEESSEESKESSGPHKRESPVIPPQVESASSTEHPDVTRAKEINTLAVTLPARIPPPVAVS